MTGKNITLTVPEDVYQRARVRAAERGTSVSRLVSDYLLSLADNGTEFKRLETQQALIQQRLGTFSAGDRLDRDELHDRAVR